MELNTEVYVAGVTQKVAGGQMGVADSQSIYLNLLAMGGTTIRPP
jgi:hypothetical protein